MKTKQKTTLLFAGMMIGSASQIAAHFTKMPDFISGALLGIGIGVMLLGLIKQKRDTAW